MRPHLIASRWMLIGSAVLAGCASKSPSPSGLGLQARYGEDGGGDAANNASAFDAGGPTFPSPSDGGPAHAEQDSSTDHDSGLFASDAASHIDLDAAGSTNVDGGACTIAAASARCNTAPIVTVKDSADSRDVYWAAPTSTPPEAGWPAVLLYQGTGFGPSVTWNIDITTATPFGGYYQVALVAALLDAGFLVIQPPANGPAWDTNVGDYATSPDAAFIPQLLTEMANGTFGKIDMTRLYATGISSGGYMTSRMAVSYAGKFRALATESGSYATCLGPICSIPATLPADHPPTLFLHGGADPIVPINTAQAYYTELVAQGIATTFVEDPSAGHQWLSTAPQDVVQWFTTH